MNPLARRSVISGLAAAGSLTLLGCGWSGKKQDRQAQTTAGTSRSATAAPQAAAMRVYRDPNCGCCEAWAKQARAQEFAVTVIDQPDMPAIKRQYGVPEGLSSCHTAIVAGYAIEGHVPFADVRRLLTEKPNGVRGLAVAGMPRGSPGMETADGSKEPFEVMAFDAEGRARIYSKQQV